MQDWDACHDDIEVFLNKPSRRKLILIPRGHLKSSIVTIGFSIQQILKNPNIRILIANQVWDKSREFLFQIKEYLTSKSELPKIFGSFESDRWREDDVTIRQRTKALAAPTISTTGVEAEKTGSHYDLILNDDLMGLTNFRTKEQRDKAKAFYSSTIDLLDPGAQMCVIGTRWHLDDVYADIIEKESAYYDIMVRKVIEKGRIIFPKKFNLRFDDKTKLWLQSSAHTMDYINYLKASKKSSEFYSQYMNEPISEEDQKFRPDYFRYWSDRPERLFVGMCIDPAIGLDREADYTAITVCGMDSGHKIYVMDRIRGHWKASQIIDNVFTTYSKWKPDATGFEMNGFQITLKEGIEAEMRRRKTYFPITEIRHPSNKNKEARIECLEPFYKNGMILHSSWMKGGDLEEELLTFPKGKHDDLIDSLAMQLEVLMPAGNAPSKPMDENCWEALARKGRKMMTPYSFFHD